MTHEIKVFAPATVANVGCGFDIFGLALETPGDEVIVRMTSTPGVKITSIVGDNGKLSLDPEKNTAAVSVINLLSFLNIKLGVEIQLIKKMPLGSGLGSSAASAAASVYAVNALLNHPLSPKDLIPFAMEAERVACGAAHADNVAPALLGGFVLIRSYDPLDVVQISIPIQIYVTILHPKIEIHTADAREILKPEVSLRQMIQQTGNASGLIAGLLQGNAELISRSLTDVVIEPLRSRLIPGFFEMKQAALNAGALGCSISGSGPSLFALSLSTSQAQHIGQEMVKACRLHNTECDVYISPISREGPKIL